MASNGNKLPTVNTNRPAAIAGSSYQVAPQIIPLLMRNLTVPAPKFQKNCSNNGSQNSTPRTFSAPLPSPKPMPLLSIIIPSPDFQQKNSDNRQQSSQIATLKDGYESRIRQLNLTIQLLKSSEQQTLFKLEEECAKFNYVVARKDSELKDLETRLESMDAKNITERIDGYESRIKQLNLTIQLLKSSEQQTLFNMEAKCAKFNDVVNRKNSELEATELKLRKLEYENFELAQKLEIAKSTTYNLHTELDNRNSELQICKDRLKKADEEYYELSFQINNLEDELELNQDICHVKSSEQQKIFKLEAECAKFNDVVPRKDSELKDLESKLRKAEDENFELAQTLETAKSVSEQLQTELDNQTAELQNCKDRLKKADEEYYELNFQVNNLEDELDQKEKDMLRMQKLSNKTNAELYTCQVDLEKALADISHVTDERDILKVELESASATSQELKAELEVSKKSIEELTTKLEKLKAESQRPSNLSVLKRDTIVLDDTIDLTIIDSDDEMSPSSLKKKRKAK